MHNKRLLVLVTVVMFVSFVGLAYAGGQKESGGSTGAATAAAAPHGLTKVYKAKMPSEEIKGDFMTVWAEKFADHMRKWSDGKIDITVYPYGTLGDSRDVVEVTQMGVTELVYADYGWLSSFVPETQVFGLHYLWPREKTGQVMQYVLQHGKILSVLEKYYRHNGFVPLGFAFEGWQWVTSRQPRQDLQEFKNFKIRVMGSKMLVKDYQAYGANPTPMSYGEVYSGLQTGLIDGQANPLFAINSMKFYEVQNYLTQLYAEAFVGIPAANMQWFDSLPKAAQQEMRNWWANSIVDSTKWIDARNAADRKKMEAAKPSLKFVSLTPAETKPFEKIAKDQVYQQYLKIGGPGAKEVLDTLLSDIATAKKKLGVQ